MYQSPEKPHRHQQMGALFVIVFGLLLLAGIVVFLLSMREDANTSHRAAATSRT
jgi:hypothetical protein